MLGVGMIEYTSINRQNTLRAAEMPALLEEAKCAISQKVDADGLVIDSNSASEGDASDCSDFPNDSLQEILDDLEVYTQCLMDLDPLIKWSVPDVNVEEHPATLPLLTNLTERAPHYHYVDLISVRFPQVDADLVEGLGKANWNRYQRMQAERLSNLAHLEDHALKESDATAKIITGSKFHDSGLGSSIQATTAYAATVVSMISSLAEGSRAHIPRLSEDAK